MIAEHPDVAALAPDGDGILVLVEVIFARLLFLSLCHLLRRFLPYGDSPI